MWDKEFIVNLIKDNKPSKAVILPALLSVSLFATSIVSSADAKSYVKIDNDGKVFEYEIKGGELNVGDLLSRTGYELNSNDKLNMDMSDSLASGDTIKIRHKKKVSLKTGLNEMEVDTYAATVGELLDEYDISVDSDDKLNKKLNDKLNENDKIEHIIVESKKEVKEKRVKPNVRYEYTDELSYGDSVEFDPGSDAVFNDTYENIYENGKLISKNVVSSRQTSLGKDKVIKLGSKRVETREIDFEVERRVDPDLRAGEEKVARAGEKGVLEITSIYDPDLKSEKSDGFKVSDAKVVKDPVNRVILVGSNENTDDNSTEEVIYETYYVNTPVENTNDINEESEDSAYEKEVSKALNTTGQNVVNTARNYVGGPYVWGGTSLRGGIDCSGFTMRIYGMYGIGLPHQSGQQLPYGRSVRFEDRQPGDLLLFGTPGNIYHVGIANEYGGMIHASNPRDGIVEGPIWNRPYAVKRLFN